MINMERLNTLRAGIRDAYKNRLFMQGRSVMMNLYDRGECKKIGEFKKSGEDYVLIQKRGKKYLFQKTNSYGFNYELLAMLPREMNINIVTPMGNMKYVVSVGYILQNGKFLHFLNRGFEKQIFVSIDELENIKKKY